MTGSPGLALERMVSISCVSATNLCRAWVSYSRLFVFLRDRVLVMASPPPCRSKVRNDEDGVPLALKSKAQAAASGERHCRI